RRDSNWTLAGSRLAHGRACPRRVLHGGARGAVVRRVLLRLICVSSHPWACRLCQAYSSVGYRRLTPARVIGFLDVAGHWDSTLLLVMAGALVITVPIFPVILRRPKTLLAAQFTLPTKTRLDLPLVLGAPFSAPAGDWQVSVRDRHWALWPRDHRA